MVTLRSAFELPTPRTSPILSAPSDAPLRPLRKRRLTAPADLQLVEPTHQPHKKLRTKQAGPRKDTIETVGVDELIPQFTAMGKDTLYTPLTGGYDSASIPFVFDDGVLSFYTPSLDDANYGPSLPSSAISPSFFHDASGALRSKTHQNSTDLRELSIWRGGGDGPSHIYTQMLDRNTMRETTSIRKLDPSLTTYGPVYTAMTQFSCQFIHVEVPLAIPSSMVDPAKPSNSSSITIASSRRNPVRLLTTLFNHGTLVSSHEVQMEEQSGLNAETTLYSAPLPQELIDRVCEFDQGDDKDLPSNRSCSGVDSIVIMRFVQPEDPTTNKDDTLLVIAAKFFEIQSSSPAQVKISNLKAEVESSSALHHSRTPLPTPPPSHEHFTNIAKPSKFQRRPQLLGRPIPKLSVAIPPPSMQGINGIQLCTDSPESAMRPVPRTGIPSNVYPVTPFEQLIGTTSQPPELTRSSARSLSNYAPTPSESAYPFTLASTSPGPAPSPAFGVLDPGSALSSAPAWMTLARNITPFTPSFFMHPHTAAASNAMSSLTQRAIDAGTPVSSYKDEYFGPPPLASPLPIVSPSQFLPSPDE